ncbi:hypothetical protein K402DRAFT_126379 [Aulographum hederae CBS 113979]|uniref:Uncharacterized protein n=1 Tax=Aulographum hederae CBS 113979 TaxID=1176131 RepID=A0A6G1HE87_9PEZI|nr:hypothetical protein K402DRAFT_126379 [Aulographum hederae CBS 113979]
MELPLFNLKSHMALNRGTMNRTSSTIFDIYAAGFNDFRQLDFDTDGLVTEISTARSGPDTAHFQKIASGESIEVLYVDFSNTIINHNSTYYLLGALPWLQQPNEPCPIGRTRLQLPQNIDALKSFFPLNDSLYGAVTTSGEVLTFRAYENQSKDPTNVTVPLIELYQISHPSNKIQAIATTVSGAIAVLPFTTAGSPVELYQIPTSPQPDLQTLQLRNSPSQARSRTSQPQQPHSPLSYPMPQIQIPQHQSSTPGPRQPISGTPPFLPAPSLRPHHLPRLPQRP